MKGTGKKATSWVNFPKKQPHGHAEKATSWDKVKTTSNTIPVPLMGVMAEDELRKMLLMENQGEWVSKKRIAGLLLIIDYIARKKKDTTVSSLLSRDYVSHLARVKAPSTIRQPLPLLVKIGILEITQAAVITAHRKTPARYRLHPSKGNPRTIQAMLSTQQRDKMKNWEPRREDRYNKRYPIRKQLLLDLSQVNLSPAGDRLALSMISAKSKSQSINTMMEYIEGHKEVKVSIDPTGTIHTFVRQVPRELKSHLTINGKPVAICDIESAHLCVLSTVVQERIDFRKMRGCSTEDLEHERRGFIALLESADIYEHLADGGDRSTFKKSLLASINTPTKKAVHIEAYQRFKRSFPLTVDIIEDIKSTGHKGISRPLQHLTARIIEGAMREAQSKGIPCLPDTDALIVPRAKGKEITLIINRNLAAITGIQK